MSPLPTVVYLWYKLLLEVTKQKLGFQSMINMEENQEESK